MPHTPLYRSTAPLLSIDSILPSKVLWVFAVASPDGRAYLQLFLDLDILQFCVRGSSLRGEIRFRTPAHLACGGARVWHHVLLGHSRPKSRILGTKDKLCLWVDGELCDTVKVKWALLFYAYFVEIFQDLLQDKK